ncbi:MAG: hypothetical protein MRQ11_06220 [Candidatus Midichloria mitochondrii]|nr:hypothetical protein [Candidatus Midichloria mitochondrii]MDJ1584252.1 hypothetical protein [Candidatus Midichloria mitochondrii]
MPSPAQHGIACQTISWQTSSQGSWLMSSNPIYLMENRLTGPTPYVKLRLYKSCNSTKSLKDIEILEIDEPCTYIKKDQRMEVGVHLYMDCC